jgi:hypothetical protein
METIRRLWCGYVQMCVLFLPLQEALSQQDDFVESHGSPLAKFPFSLLRILDFVTYIHITQNA